MASPCNKIERITKLETTLELSNKEIMKEIFEIKSNMKEGFSETKEVLKEISLKLESIPDTYATKNEVQEVKDTIKLISENNVQVKTSKIQQRGAIGVALVAALGTVANILFGK